GWGPGPRGWFRGLGATGGGPAGCGFRESIREPRNRGLPLVGARFGWAPGVGNGWFGLSFGKACNGAFDQTHDGPWLPTQITYREPHDGGPEQPDIGECGGRKRNEFDVPSRAFRRRRDVGDRSQQRHAGGASQGPEIDEGGFELVTCVC